MTSDLTNPGNPRGTTLAHARWTDPLYVAEKYAYQEGAIWLGRCPHDPERAIGYKDDRHVFVCAETRSGKGRAFMVNNQVLWPGSLITVGPKGEEATIAAERRGAGNAYCDGLGQEVYVLDPMGATQVPDGLRAHFNLLAALDPNDGELVSKVDRIANAICRIPPDAAEAAEWAKKGKAYVASVMLHVVTADRKHIEDQGLARDILTVRDLVTEGHYRRAAQLNQDAKAKAAPGETPKAYNPYKLLLLQMENNPACHGAVARYARDMLHSNAQHVRYFESVRSAAVEHLRFLEGQGIINTVSAAAAGAAWPRTFRVEDIKDKRISVFLCLPEHNYDPLDRWLRAMIEILIGGMQERQGLGANGERVLFCIDEFANLGRMDSIAKAANSIAGAGVKLMIAVQRLGELSDPKLYGNGWEKFISSAGTQIWFGAEEMETRKYLERKLGQTEVSLFGRSISKGRSTSSAESLSESYSHTNSLSTAESVSEGTSHTSSRSTAEAVSEGSSHTDNRSTGTTAGRTASSGTSRTSAQSRGSAQTRGQSQGYSTSDGRTSGRNYGPHIFFEPFAHGTSRGKTSGRNWSQGQNDQRSTSTGSTRTEGYNESQGTSYAQSEARGASDTRTAGTTRTAGMGESDSRTEGRTRTDGTGESDSRTQGKTHTQTSGESEGATLTESFHVKALLSALEAKQLLRSLPEVEREHPAYPGFALITLADEEHPFFVRKANHDQDPFFAHKFNPNPAYKFIPYDQQPLLGWQITPEHFYTVQIPSGLSGYFAAQVIGGIEPGDRITRGQEFLDLVPEVADYWLTEPPDYRPAAPFPFKVFDIEEGAVRDHRKILSLRADVALDENRRGEFESALWSRWLESTKIEHDVQSAAWGVKNARHKMEMRFHEKDRVWCEEINDFAKSSDLEELWRHQEVPIYPKRGLFGLSFRESSPIPRIEDNLSPRDAQFKRDILKAIRRFEGEGSYFIFLYGIVNDATTAETFYTAAGDALFYGTGDSASCYGFFYRGVDDKKRARLRLPLESLIRSVASDATHPFTRVAAATFFAIELRAITQNMRLLSSVGHVNFPAQLYARAGWEMHLCSYEHYSHNKIGYKPDKSLAYLGPLRQEETADLRRMLEPVADDPGHPYHGIVMSAFQVTKAWRLFEAGSVEDALAASKSARELLATFLQRFAARSVWAGGTD
ncbi:type IV secretory system conjugative DNA transfer family protein [uncultured Thiodictyon sp.]|uniref:type IV secretory system conjugative DNA transfer family protein n=1 Tax=uncultured Thiodictyon sp. TaxID=1846217 RepID=UPI0025F14B40|nr:type IV secretory system conjugative DNA transfer family protein [uncultured Thiodictyon sp.]